MEIIVNNVYSTLVDVDSKTESDIDRALAVFIPGVQYTAAFRQAMGSWDGRQHLYNERTKQFPTGLLGLVLDLVGPVAIDDKRTDVSEVVDKALMRATTIELKDITLADFQRYDGLIKAIEAKRGRLYFSVNSGKSEIIIALSECLDLKTIWLTDKIDLMRQAVDRYRQRTGRDCGYIGDGAFIDDDKMIVAMVPTIYRLSKKRLAEFMSQFGLLIVDEADALRSKSWYTVAMMCPAPFRYAMTGSPPKDKYTSYKMSAATDINVIARRSNQENINIGWSARPTIHLQQLIYPDNSLSYSQAYNTMIRFNRPYASIVADEIYSWYKQGKKTLILVEKVRQGANIAAELRGRGVECTYLQGNDDSDYRHDKLNEFRDSQIEVLIGTRILARGIDLPQVNVLVLAAGGRSTGQQLQRLGRALRRKKEGENIVEIVDYIHSGNKYMLEHSLERIKLYQREGFDIKWRKDSIQIN